MDFRALRYSLAIARLGSFTKAAQSLHVAQPALSVSIKKLEAELGVTLFVRKARRVEPTVEGTILLQRAERMFAEMELAIHEIADTVELRTGLVRVGMPPMYGLAYFPALIAQFHEAYPGIALSVTEGSADETGRLLDAGTIDLAMIETRRIRSQWQQVVVGEEEMVLCVAPTHPFAKRKTVRAEDLDKLPMVLFSGSFIQRDLINKFCKKAGAVPNVVLQSNSVSLIRKAATDGLGAATLLRSLAAPTPQLVPISLEPREILHFSLCWRDDRYLSRANRAFVDFATRLGRVKQAAKAK